MRLKILFVSIAAAAGLISCFFTGRDLAGRLESAGDDYVVIGCLELDPPLRPDEQAVRHMAGGRDLENRIVFAMGEKPREAGDLTGYTGGYDDFVIAEPGKYFFLRQKRCPRFHLSAIHVILGFRINQSNRAGATTVPRNLEIPASFLIEPPEGERLLYIGRIVFHRDRGNRIRRIEIIDEFDSFAVEPDGAAHRTTDLCRVRPRPGAGTRVEWK